MLNICNKNNFLIGELIRQDCNAINFPEINNKLYAKTVISRMKRDTRYTFLTVNQVSLQDETGNRQYYSVYHFRDNETKRLFHVSINTSVM